MYTSAQIASTVVAGNRATSISINCSNVGSGTSTNGSSGSLTRASHFASSPNRPANLPSTSPNIGASIN